MYDNIKKIAKLVAYTFLCCCIDRRPKNKLIKKIQKKKKSENYLNFEIPVFQNLFYWLLNYFTPLLLFDTKSSFIRLGILNKIVKDQNYLA